MTKNIVSAFSLSRKKLQDLETKRSLMVNDGIKPLMKIGFDLLGTVLKILTEIDSMKIVKSEGILIHTIRF